MLLDLQEDKRATSRITEASDLSPQFESSRFFYCIYESQLALCIRSLRLSRVGKLGGLSPSRQSFGCPENLLTTLQSARDAKVPNWHIPEVRLKSAFEEPFQAVARKCSYYSGAAYHDGLSIGISDRARSTCAELLPNLKYDLAAPVT